MADNSSDEQRELLKKISEMVEGGVITKATVRELLNIMSERGKVSARFDILGPFRLRSFAGQLKRCFQIHRSILAI